MDLTPVLAIALCGTAWAADPGPGLRLAPAFVSGTGGYHTYRIPALIVGRDGTPLANECERGFLSVEDSPSEAWEMRTVFGKD